MRAGIIRRVRLALWKETTVWRRRSPEARGRLRARCDRLFLEREIILRSDGKVRYVKIGRRAQKLAAGVAVVALCWGGYVNLSYLEQMHQSLNRL